jgi:hypothetical protein
MYKEYLEKIYTLCSNCQSKVKFEITKQDGILKQYLLNLGMFHNFFERKISHKNPQLNGSGCETRISFNLAKLTQFTIMLVILLLTLFIVAFNSYETGLNSTLQIISEKPNTQTNESLDTKWYTFNLFIN